MDNDTNNSSGEENNISENLSDELKDIVNTENTEDTEDTENIKNINTNNQNKTEKNEKTNQQLIMEIHRDKSLTAEEKAIKIKDVMLGKYKNIEKIHIPDCTHYKKKCNNFIFECCGRVYDCCRCHNQASLCNKPILISEIVCSECNTKQIPSNTCVNCKIKFSRSHCEICNIWSEKNIYHCDKCGLCRVGSLDKYFHCDNCQGCFKISGTPHSCATVLSATTQCLLCLETSASTSQYHLMALSCKHPVHSECLNLALRNGNYKCPMCRKSMINMQHYWTLKDQEILLHPLPEDVKKKINILCYDCGAKTENADWHIFGTKCNSCNSYNTSSE